MHATKSLQAVNKCDAGHLYQHAQQLSTSVFSKLPEERIMYEKPDPCLWITEVPRTSTDRASSWLSEIIKAMLLICESRDKSPCMDDTQLFNLPTRTMKLAVSYFYPRAVPYFSR